MNNPIEVTFLFKNEDAFRTFVKKNCNDEYTYRKGKYIVDMTEEVKSMTADTTGPQASSTSSSVLTEDTHQSSSTDSMF